MLKRLSLILLSALVMATPARAALKVVTTVPDLAALVAEVGGEHVRVTTMSSPHQDPHYVDPKPSLVVAVAQADLLVVNELGSRSVGCPRLLSTVIWLCKWVLQGTLTHRSTQTSKRASASKPGDG